MTDNNSLSRGILGEKFKLETMITQRDKEVTKKAEWLQVSLL